MGNLGQSLAISINYLLSGHIAPASISTCFVCLAIESLALLRKIRKKEKKTIEFLALLRSYSNQLQLYKYKREEKNTKTPLGLQLAASDQHARWPGVLHCPHSKGRLSLTCRDDSYNCSAISLSDLPHCEDPSVYEQLLHAGDVQL